MANLLDQLRADVGAVLARRERTSRRVDFEKYKDDPVGFCTDIVHADLWSAQREMAEAVRDHSQVAIVSGNAIGKDFLMARLALWWVYCRHGFVIFTSVTDRQARGITMRELRRAFLNAPALYGELFQMELRVDETSGVLAFTSDSIERLVGWHHDRLLICLSEAQGLDAGVFEAAHAMATGSENKIVCYGNPTAPTSMFHTVATSDTWHTITVPATAHPNVAAQREEIPGGPSVAWIESMAAEYGRDSSIYKSRVLSEWPDESIEGLVKRSWMLAAFQRHADGALRDRAWRYRPPAADDPSNPMSDLKAARLGYSPLLALDVARYGADHSVLAVVRGCVVEELITWHGLSTDASADRVIAEAERLWTNREVAPPIIVVDDVGVGGGCTDYLRRHGWWVHAYNGGSKAIDPKHYLNLRAQSFWRFRELLERNEIALPKDDQLLEEALSIEWFIAPSGAVQIVSKDDIKKTLGRSPDRLDAVVMGLSQTVGNVTWGSYTSLVYT